MVLYVFIIMFVTMLSKHQYQCTEKELETNHKIVLVGDPMVGKTQIVNRLMGINYNEDYTVTKSPQQYKIGNLDICDLPGNITKDELYQQLENASCILFVYDCLDEQSFSNIDSIWYEYVSRYETEHDYIAKILVGNKYYQYMPKTYIDEVNMGTYLKVHGFGFEIKQGQYEQKHFCVSAEYNDGIKEMFETIVEYLDKAKINIPQNTKFKNELNKLPPQNDNKQTNEVNKLLQQNDNAQTKENNSCCCNRCCKKKEDVDEVPDQNNLLFK